VLWRLVRVLPALERRVTSELDRFIARSVRDCFCISRSIFEAPGSTAGAGVFEICFLAFVRSLVASGSVFRRFFFGEDSSSPSPMTCFSFRFALLTRFDAVDAARWSFDASPLVFGPRTPRQFSAPQRHFWIFFFEKGLEAVRMQQK
jgi:hypothetical protein